MNGMRNTLVEHGRKTMNKKEIDIDDELEKRYEKFHEWLDTCPFKWTESSHPTSGMTCVNFEIEEE